MPDLAQLRQEEADAFEALSQAFIRLSLARAHLRQALTDEPKD